MAVSAASSLSLRALLFAAIVLMVLFAGQRLRQQWRAHIRPAVLRNEIAPDNRRRAETQKGRQNVKAADDNHRPDHTRARRLRIGHSVEAHQNVRQSCRAEDQRQALRLMVHTKTPPPKTDAVLDAYRAAKTRIETLADQSKEPADYEMLGMCQVMLGEASARDTFQTALTLERTRNPTSCGRR